MRLEPVDLSSLRLLIGSPWSLLCAAPLGSGSLTLSSLPLNRLTKKPRILYCYGKHRLFYNIRFILNLFIYSINFSQTAPHIVPVLCS